MRVLAIVHQPDAGPGVFAEAAAARGDELVVWAPSSAPEPPDPEVDAVLVLGGGMHPDQHDEHPWLVGEKRLLRGWLDTGTPLLGVCLGAELIGEVAGAPPVRLPAPEIGWRRIPLTPEAGEDPVFADLPRDFDAFQWHSFSTPLPPGATPLAARDGVIDAFRLGSAWAIQFHAEVTLEIVDAWLDDHEADPDAVAIGFDPAPVRAATPDRIPASESLGRALFTAFLDAAARPVP